MSCRGLDVANVYHRQGSGNGRSREPRRPGFSPVGFLKHIGDEMAKAKQLVSLRRRSSPEVSSKTFVAPTNSHGSEAIEDCIRFIHSSSLKRSISVSPNSG